MKYCCSNTRYLLVTLLSLLWPIGEWFVMIKCIRTVEDVMLNTNVIADVETWTEFPFANLVS